MTTGPIVSFNAARFDALNLIINSYKTKTLKQSNGTMAPIAADDNLEQLHATLSTTLNSLDVGAQFNEASGEHPLRVARRELGQASDEVQSDFKGVETAINDFFRKGANADKTFTASNNKFKFQTNNTWAGVAKAKTGEEAAQILLNDCLPCQFRLDFNLGPLTSFLDMLINVATKFLSSIRDLVSSMLNFNDLSATMCAVFNMFNFTCFPDLNAILLMLAKSLVVSIKIPSFRVPGLGTIFSAILAPILGIVANIAQLWFQLVVNPVDCAIKSIQTFVKNFRINPEDFVSKLQLGLDIDIGEQQLGTKSPLQAPASALAKDTSLQKLDQAFNGTLKSDALRTKLRLLDNDTKKRLAKDINEALKFDKLTKSINKAVKTLESVSRFLQDTRNKIMGLIQKWLNKFKASLNQTADFMFSLSNMISEIAKIVGMIAMVVALIKFFDSNINGCADQQTEWNRVVSMAGKEVMQSIPGATPASVNPKSEDGIVELTRDVQLTDKEIKALNLKELSALPNVRVETQSDPKALAGSNVLNVTITNVVDMSKCLPLVQREMFASVDRLITQF